MKNRQQIKLDHPLSVDGGRGQKVSPTSRLLGNLILLAKGREPNWTWGKVHFALSTLG